MDITVPTPQNQTLNPPTDQANSFASGSPLILPDEEKVSNPTVNAQPTDSGKSDTNTSTQLSDVSYDDILNKDILELLGVKDMEEAKKNELYKKMLDTIQNNAFLRILDSLSQEDSDKFQELIDGDNPESIKDFLKEHDIDLQKIMMEEALIYKSDMVNLQTLASKQ